MFRVRRFAVHAVLPALLIVSAAARLIGQVRSVAEAAVFPELPRVYLDTTYALPTGPTITVPPGGDFQAALNSAQPGSVIVLTAGATYAGNFTLPNKTGTGWIYIQSSALSSLPAPGTRVSPPRPASCPASSIPPAIPRFKPPPPPTITASSALRSPPPGRPPAAPITPSSTSIPPAATPPSARSPPTWYSIAATFTAPPPATSATG